MRKRGEASRRGGLRRRRGPAARTGIGLAASLAFAVAAAPLSAAQESDAASGHEHSDTDAVSGPVVGPPALPAESPLVEVRLDEAERVVELVVGPVELPAGGPHLRPPVQLAGIPVAGWLHGFAWEIRDAAGNVLPDRLLHHVNVIDPDRRELFSAVPRRVMAAGRETRSESMPGLLGVPIEPGTRFLISAMFATRPDVSFEEAYLHIALDYTPVDDPGLLGPFEVLPFYLDVMGPVGEKEFPLPPGTHGMSWEGSPAVGGRILAVGGHLHDYGDWIRLEDLTAGKVVWETEPSRADDGGVIGVPVGKLWWRGGVRIYPDHVYRLSVQYTNPLDRRAPDGAMGALGGIVLVGDDPWPAFDREHPDYVADLRNTLEKPNEPGGHAHGMDAMGETAEQGAEARGHGAAGQTGPAHDHGSGGAGEPARREGLGGG